MPEASWTAAQRGVACPGVKIEAHGRCSTGIVQQGFVLLPVNDRSASLAAEPVNHEKKGFAGFRARLLPEVSDLAEQQ